MPLLASHRGAAPAWHRVRLGGFATLAGILAACVPAVVEFPGETSLGIGNDSGRPDDTGSPNESGSSDGDDTGPVDTIDSDGGGGDGDSALGDSGDPGPSLPLDAETAAALVIRGDASDDAIGAGGVGWWSDVDGDGADDLLVGAPSWDAGDRGAIAAFGAGLHGPGDVAFSAGNLVLGVASRDLFGASFDVAGDLDGSGDTLVVAGAPGSDLAEDAGAGAVWVFAFDAARAGAAVDELRAEYFAGRSNQGAFGSAVGVGDFDGDGLADLAASGVGERRDGGRVYVFFGIDAWWEGPAGESDEAEQEHERGVSWGVQYSVHGENDNDALGTALLLGDGAPGGGARGGDFDGDGYGDLLACAPGFDTPGDGAGACWVIGGEADPQSDDESVSIEALAWIRGAAAGDGVGETAASVHASDLDGDGRTDLVVGLVGSDSASTDGGAVAVFYGPLSGDRGAEEGLAAVGDGALGSCVTTLGDRDGDGAIEGLGGARRSGSVGAVSLFALLAGSGTIDLPGDADAAWTGAARDDGFGSACSAARLGGSDEIAVAAPGNDATGAGAGAVYLLALP